MTGSDSIDSSLPALWRCWQEFRRGKKRTTEFDRFQYRLCENLRRLSDDIADGSYRHGGYHAFTVSDTKRRRIAVASIRDRVVHRLLYNHLVERFDRTFDFDAWSCRVGKGLTGAVERAQRLLCANRDGWFWRADVTRFFDNVDHAILRGLLARRIGDPEALRLSEEIIGSYHIHPARGIPIGNLTSQAFANVFLNELDRFVRQAAGARAYLRYGDDFVLFGPDRSAVSAFRVAVTDFLRDELRLAVHPRNDVVRPCRRRLRWLGFDLFPRGRRLCRRNRLRIARRLDTRNVASYAGVAQSEGSKRLLVLQWAMIDRMEHGDGRYAT